MSDRHNFVYPRQTWETVAGSNEVYGAICHGWSRERFETEPRTIFQEVVDCSPGAVVVDLGCGIGRVVRWVAPYVKHYIGLDFAQPMVARARDYNAVIGNATFLWSDTLAILPVESVDLIFSEQVFIHCTREQQLKYLAEAPQVLKPGGQLLVVVPDAEHYVNGFEPCELVSQLAGYHYITTQPHDLTFLLRARKAGADEGTP